MGTQLGPTVTDRLAECRNQPSTRSPTSFPEPTKQGVGRRKTNSDYPRFLSLDSLALFAVFLQATDLYRPLGYTLKFPNSLYVNIFFLVGFAIYLAVRIETLKNLSSGALMAWSWALVGIPLAVMSIQSLDNSTTWSRTFYWTLFSLLFVLMLWVVSVLWFRWGPVLSKPFFLAAIGAAWLGFSINWIDYQFLREVMAHGSIQIWVSEYTTRAIGFYQHPNAAAFALVLYFSCLVCDKRFIRGSIVVQIIAAMASLVGVLITGSRTSLLLLAIVFFWYLRNMTRSEKTNAWERESQRKRALLAPLIPIAVLAVSIIFIQLITISRQDLSSMVSNRLTSLTNLGSDTSTDQRMLMLARYLSDILESPLLGFGPDFASNQISNGSYINVSQNAWLEWSVALGVPYALFMAALLIYTYRFSMSRSGFDPLVASFTRLTIAIFAIVSFSMVNPFWLRTAVCILGVIIGIAMYSQDLSSSRATSSSPDATRSKSPDAGATQEIQRSKRHLTPHGATLRSGQITQRKQ